MQNIVHRYYKQRPRLRWRNQGLAEESSRDKSHSTPTLSPSNLASYFQPSMSGTEKRDHRFSLWSDGSGMEVNRTKWLYAGIANYSGGILKSAQDLMEMLKIILENSCVPTGDQHTISHEVGTARFSPDLQADFCFFSWTTDEMIDLHPEYQKYLNMVRGAQGNGVDDGRFTSLVSLWRGWSRRRQQISAIFTSLSSKQAGLDLHKLFKNNYLT